MKGRITFTDLFDRPFREVHELYRIVYLKAQAEAEREKQRQAEEEEKRKQEEKANRPRGIPNLPKPYKPNSKQPTDDISQHTMSPLEAEELQDMLEDMAEGGIM